MVRHWRTFLSAGAGHVRVNPYFPQPDKIKYPLSSIRVLHTDSGRGYFKYLLLEVVRIVIDAVCVINWGIETVNMCWFYIIR